MSCRAHGHMRGSDSPIKRHCAQCTAGGPAGTAQIEVCKVQKCAGPVERLVAEALEIRERTQAGAGEHILVNSRQGRVVLP